MRSDLFAAPPSPREMDMNPELAFIRLLQELIAMTIPSLRTAYPELDEDEPPPWFSLTPAACVAQLLIKQLALTADILPDYRAALLVEWAQPRASADRNAPPF